MGRLDANKVWQELFGDQIAVRLSSVEGIVTNCTSIALDYCAAKMLSKETTSSEAILKRFAR